MRMCHYCCGRSLLSQRGSEDVIAQFIPMLRIGLEVAGKDWG